MEGSVVLGAIPNHEAVSSSINTLHYLHLPYFRTLTLCDHGCPDGAEDAYTPWILNVFYVNLLNTYLCV